MFGRRVSEKRHAGLFRRDFRLVGGPSVPLYCIFRNRFIRNPCEVSPVIWTGINLVSVASVWQTVAPNVDFALVESVPLFYRFGCVPPCRSGVATDSAFPLLCGSRF